MKSFSFVILALIVFTLSANVEAQTSKGFVVGTVLDQNGAAIPGASIRITSVETGATRETVSQDDGSYRFDAVDPSTYRLEANAPGFSPVQREAVVVTAAQTADIGIQLSVSGGSNVVEVSASSTVELQTSDGTRSNTLDQRQITELPVLNFNPAQLISTLPGVADTTQSLGGGFVQGNEFSVNGLRPRANNQLIDGLDNNDNSIGGQFYIPSVRDGYDQTSILQSNYSAEYGRAGGAIINITTRRGTNDYNGSFYDVIQNSDFNSLRPDEKRSGLTEVPQSSQNTFGFSLGGPIRFPRFGEGGPALFNGKDKAFFFTTFQADLIRAGGVIANGFVPTEAGFNTLRSQFAPGVSPNLDYYLGILGNVRGVTNPYNISIGAGRPAVEFATATTAAAQPVNTYDNITRIDITPNENESYSFRYLITDQIFSNQITTVFEGFEVDVPSLTQNFFASYTRVFTPNITNEFRFGYGRFNAFFTPRNPAVGAAGPLVSFGGAGLGSGVSTIGLAGNLPQGRIFNNFQFQDTVSITAGDHSFRLGADLNVQRSKQLVPFNSRGSLAFAAGGGANAFQNFIEGFSGNRGASARVFGDAVVYPDAFYQNYFINDTWRVSRNLTLNFGLRYENYGTPFNVVAFPAFPGFDQTGTTAVRQRSDNNNFAPRVSFAYSPDFGGLLGNVLGSTDTVIRGGFAINYDFFFNNILSNTAASIPNVLGGSFNDLSTTGRGTSDFTINSAIPSAPGAFNPRANITTIDPNLINPQTYLYNLGIQRRLPGNFIADVAYVGSRGTRLFVTEQLNPVVNGARLFPNRGGVTARTNGADSSYNSLQTRLERGFKNGFFVRGTYTFSKSIDNTSEVFATSGGSSLNSNPFDRSVDRGPSTFDVPHVGTISGIYDFPTFGSEGIVRSLLGGFRLGGVYRIQSGAPETAYINGLDVNGDGSAFNDRPEVFNPNAPARVAIANDIGGTTSPTGFADVNGNSVNPGDYRFVVTSTRLLPISGRNTLRGPKFDQLDLNLRRSFGLGFLGSEDMRFEIRADFFNVLNSPNFLPGTGDVLASTFNDPFINGVGTRRTGRIELRVAF